MRYYLAVVVEGEGEVVVVFPVSGCLGWRWRMGKGRYLVRLFVRYRKLTRGCNVESPTRQGNCGGGVEGGKGVLV